MSQRRQTLLPVIKPLFGSGKLAPTQEKDGFPVAQGPRLLTTLVAYGHESSRYRLPCPTFSGACDITICVRCDAKRIAAPVPQTTRACRSAAIAAAS